MGEPSVSNCWSPSAVATTPASLSRCWRVSSKSSIESLYGTSTWTVNEVGVRAMIVAFMVPVPRVRTGNYRQGRACVYIIPRSNPAQRRYGNPTAGHVHTYSAQGNHPTAGLVVLSQVQETNVA